MPDDVVKRINMMGMKGGGVDGVQFRKRHDDSALTERTRQKPLDSPTELVRIDGDVGGDDDDEDERDDPDFSEASSQTSDSTDDELISIDEEELEVDGETE